MLRRSQRQTRKAVTSSSATPSQTSSTDDVTRNEPTDEEEEEEYEVEKVVDCAVGRNGGKFYYVTFLGWHRGENQWIAAEDMNCDDKIREFERNKAKLKEERENPPEPNRLNFSPDPRRVEEDARANLGWEGSELDHVIGATAQHDTVYYLVKWTNGRIQSLRSDELRWAFPRKLIAYFESILDWS